MDTDDLSIEAYKAIMIEAESFNHDLTLQFGLLSYNCDNENEFVNKSIDLINEMMSISSFARNLFKNLQENGMSLLKGGKLKYGLQLLFTQLVQLIFYLTNHFKRGR